VTSDPVTRVPWHRGLATLSRLERVLLGATLVGVVLHVALAWRAVVLYDGTVYAYLGGSFARNGALVLDWAPSGALPVWGYGLVYPSYLAGLYGAFGFSLAVTKTAASVAALLAIAVTYATTRDLFGRTKGLLAAAVVSLDLTLIRSNYYAYAEPVVLALLVLALWSLLRGLRDSRFMPLFGVFAGLFYLSKTVLGWSFVALAVTLLLAWRFAFVRGRLLRDPLWWGGALLPLAFVAAREVLIAAGTDAVASHGIGFGFARFAEILPIAAVKLPFLAAMLLLFVVFWLPELRRAVRGIREPQASALLLGGMGFALATWWLVSAIALTEPWNPLLFEDNVRYLVLLLVPLLWLALPHMDLGPDKPPEAPRRSLPPSRAVAAAAVGGLAALVGIVVGPLLGVVLAFGAVALLIRSSGRRLALLLVASALVSAAVVAHTERPAFLEAAGALDARLRPGDAVALDDRLPAGTAPPLSPIQLYPYLSRHDIEVFPLDPGRNATFILSQTIPRAGSAHDGFTNVGTFPDPSGRYEVALWQLNGTVGR